MNVGKASIFRLLNGNNQFLIPVYQRHYNWEKRQCSRLWGDIVEMYKPQPQTPKKGEHFIGSIVSVTEEKTATSVAKYTIIDGQQRLTTLTLLLIALREYVRANPSDPRITVDLIDDALLKNKHETGSEHHKLMLTEGDEDILKNLIENIPIRDGTKSPVLTNYKFFADKIRSRELDPSQVYNSIGKLQIVDITLTKGEDDAQVIFESLNSTGKDLSQSDLIRNYLLMGLSTEEQKNIYDHYWRPMEKFFPEKDQEYLMACFFRDYLTMKLARIPREDSVYDEFKNYRAKGEFKDKENSDLCQDLYTFAKYYTDIRFCRSNKPELESLYNDIRELKMTVSYPFLIKVYDDCEKGIINENELKEVIRLCVSYVVRRKVCDIPSFALNNVFATLRNAIKQDDYMASLRAFFVRSSDTKEFPKDERFRNAFVARDMFNTRGLVDFILSRLEDYENKGKTNLSGYSVEHIMPQTLSPEWKTALGDKWRDVHATYLHTIGNLTFTAYNSEMSNKPFMEKMTMENGFRQGALRINKYLVEQTEWDETRIKERANRLADIALKMWSYPQAPREELDLENSAKE